MQSGANLMSLCNSSLSRDATGLSEYFGSGPPLGRPRCDMRISRPPRSTMFLIVGNACAIRRSSVIFPPSRGTLKSARIRTRLPFTSTSATVFLAMFDCSLRRAMLRVRYSKSSGENLTNPQASSTTVSMDVQLNSLKYDANGLVPVVVQDYKNGEILMLAWANREALEKTVQTGKVHTYSRS